MHRGVVILFHQLFGDQDRVFEVVAAPRHEGDQDVASQRQLAMIGAGTVGDDLSLRDPLALQHNRLLVDAGVLVGALELGELVNVAAHLARKLSGMMLAFDAHDDALGVDGIDDAVALGQNHSSGIASGDAFHSGADDRRFRAQQRHRLALHVGAHQCAVGVVVLEEGHQRCRHRNQLLRTDVDVIDFIAADQHKVAGLAGIDQIAHDAALVVEFHVGLRDGVAVFFPSRKIERERLELCRPLLLVFQLGIQLFSFMLFQVVADFAIAVAGIDDADVVEHASALDPPVGRLDEAVVVDPGIAAQRRNQADVRTFRRLNRADASVVRGVHVADFESRALP